MNQPEIIIIGAGLSGLNCAWRLFQCQKSFLILEASDAVGGRVRTDFVDGFRLDRGFQLFLTNYPEARRVLDYEDLQLQKFARGALIWYKGNWYPFFDPRSHPLSILKSLLSPIGTFRDKWRLLKLHWALGKGSPEEAFEREERLTLDLLRWNGGFSEQMIDRFFRPFFGGVFLEKKLVTSSRFFRFVYHMFANGDATIPATGMQAIPEQLASRLPKGSIRLKALVEKIEKGAVTLSTGEVIHARIIVVATDGAEAARLLGSDIHQPGFRSVTTLYYAADQAPIEEPIVLLDGENRGPVNHFVNLSAVAPSYAPEGVSLLSASIVGLPMEEDFRLDAKVRAQMDLWFGPEVARWNLLRVYRIKNALPDMSAATLDPPQRSVRIYPGVYVCGDHRDNASINGALESGFRTAQTVMEDMYQKIV
jgi:phytoene dehydrogenase-like protein